MSDDEFEQAATEREAAMTGLQPYQVRANRAVPNSLIRDIVADSRCGPTAPSWHTPVISAAAFTKR